MTIEFRANGSAVKAEEKGREEWVFCLLISFFLDGDAKDMIMQLKFALWLFIVCLMTVS